MCVCEHSINCQPNLSSQHCSLNFPQKHFNPSVSLKTCQMCGANERIIYTGKNASLLPGMSVNIQVIVSCVKKDLALIKGHESPKGRRQILLCGFCPQRGGGVPPKSVTPFSLKKKIRKGGRGVPPKSVKKDLDQNLVFLAVPLRREGQLYRWPRHSLTD